MRKTIEVIFLVLTAMILLSLFLVGGGCTYEEPICSFFFLAVLATLVYARAFGTRAHVYQN